MTDHLLTKRMWRGWLEATGYSEDDMSLEWCQYLLGRKGNDTPDTRSLLRYIEAWTHGYRAALDDIKTK